MSGITMAGSMARPRTKELDPNDPRGQLGLFMRHWIDEQRNPTKAREMLAKVAGVSDRAVRKWCEGVAAPDLLKLDTLAKAMGFSDWSKLAAAAVKFSANLRK